MTDGSPTNNPAVRPPARLMRHAPAALLSAAALLQLGFFSRHVDAPVFFRDEANDVFTSGARGVALLRHFMADWDPYAWILALRAWTALFGASEMAARGLCAAALLAALFLFHRFASRWFGDPLQGAAAAVLVGLGAPMMHTAIGYARPYALSLLSSVWMLDRTLALLRRPDRIRYVLFAVAAACFGNIQPVNYGLAAGLAAWIGWARLSRGVRSGSNWRAALFPILLMGLTAAPSLIQAIRFGRSETGLDAVDAAFLGPGYFARVALEWTASLFPLAQALIFYNFDDDPVGWAQALRPGSGAWPALLVAFLWGVTGFHWLARRDRRDVAHYWIPILFLILAPLAVLGWGSTRVDRLATPVRAFAAYGPGLALMLVMAARNCRPALWALALLTISRSAAALLFLQDEPVGRRSDAREAAAWMADVRADDVVLVANPALGPSFHYYYRGPAREVVLPYDGPVLYWNDLQLWKDLQRADIGPRAAARVAQAAEEGRRIWWIWGGVAMETSPDEWHPYYAPAAYRAVRAELAGRYRLVRSGRFESTGEPYRVELHEPAGEVPP